MDLWNFLLQDSQNHSRNILEVENSFPCFVDRVKRKVKEEQDAWHVRLSELVSNIGGVCDVSKHPIKNDVVFKNDQDTIRTVYRDILPAVMFDTANVIPRNLLQRYMLPDSKICEDVRERTNSLRDSFRFSEKEHEEMAKEVTVSYAGQYLSKLAFQCGFPHLAIRSMPSDVLKRCSQQGILDGFLPSVSEGEINSSYFADLSEVLNGISFDVRVAFDIPTEVKNAFLNKGDISSKKKLSKTVVTERIVGRLVVLVKEGRNLPVMDSNGLCDPYVVLELGSITQKTEVVYKSLNPTYSKRNVFLFDIPESDSILHINVWDRDKMQSDEYIGNVDIDFSSLFPSSFAEGWYTLLMNESAGGRGELNLGVAVMKDQYEEESFSSNVNTSLFALARRMCWSNSSALATVMAESSVFGGLLPENAYMIFAQGVVQEVSALQEKQLIIPSVLKHVIESISGDEWLSDTLIGSRVKLCNTVLDLLLDHSEHFDENAFMDPSSVHDFLDVLQRVDNIVPRDSFLVLEDRISRSVLSKITKYIEAATQVCGNRMLSDGVGEQRSNGDVIDALASAVLRMTLDFGQHKEALDAKVGEYNFLHRISVAIKNSVDALLQKLVVPALATDCTRNTVLSSINLLHVVRRMYAELGFDGRLESLSSFICSLLENWIDVIAGRCEGSLEEIFAHLIVHNEQLKSLSGDDVMPSVELKMKTTTLLCVESCVTEFEKSFDSLLPVEEISTACDILNRLCVLYENVLESGQEDMLCQLEKLIVHVSEEIGVSVCNKVAVDPSNSNRRRVVYVPKDALGESKSCIARDIENIRGLLLTSAYGSVLRVIKSKIELKDCEVAPDPPVLDVEPNIYETIFDVVRDMRRKIQEALLRLESEKNH